MMRRATRYHAVRGAALTVLLAGIVAIGWSIHQHDVEQNRAIHAAGLVRRLVDADILQVPAIVAEFAAYRPWADPLLRAKHDAAADGSPPKRNTSLALLPVDPEQVEYLYRCLLDAEPRELAVLRDALTPHRDRLRERLWAVVQQPERGKVQQRLRAAGALAGYDPDNPQWAQVQDQIASDLVAVPAVDVALWIEILRDVRAKLRTPLAAVFRDGRRGETEHALALGILADYAADQPPLLADLLLDTDVLQFALLFPKLHSLGESGVPPLHAELDRTASPKAAPAVRADFARRQMNAAAALLRMGRPARVWPLLKHTPDPQVRSWLIHRLGPLGVDADIILKRFDEESDVTIRRALVLSLGDFGVDRLTVADRSALIPRLLKLYRDDADPGMHGAVAWLLRHWQADEPLAAIDAELAKDATQTLERIGAALARQPRDAAPAWYVSGTGGTMVVIPEPAPFQIGSPPTEAGREAGDVDIEGQRVKRIRRSFAIAAREVTVAEFRRYRPDHPYSVQFAPTQDCPVNRVTWYDAAAYCNWLSEKDGLTCCYAPNDSGDYAPGMTVLPNHLERTGYRLPTEAEWEFACRAGARTSRFYGDAEELLGKYAWYNRNTDGKRMMPVGTLRPNDCGLFDMLGNAAEWCQDRAALYTPGDDRAEARDSEGIGNDKMRVLRGGSFALQPEHVRCASRGDRPLPATANVWYGFRPARTIR